MNVADEEETHCEKNILRSFRLDFIVTFMWITVCLIRQCSVYIGKFPWTSKLSFKGFDGRLESTRLTGQ